MPVVRRHAVVDAPAERVWTLVADPHSLPRWWPRVQRVEEATPEAWTMVLMTGSGKPVRADYTRVTAEEPHLVEWRQELAETPFERMLSEARVRIEIEPAAGAGTTVRLTTTERLRGLARLGGIMVRQAAGRRLDEALERLALAVE
jgi:uncharacterized protein YndB with AHSA1/START domain